MTQRMRMMRMTPVPNQVPNVEQVSVIETMQVGIDTVEEVGASGKRRFFGLMRRGLLTFLMAEPLVAAGAATLIWVMTGTTPELESWMLLAGVASPIASLVGVTVVIVGLLDLVVSMPTEVARHMVTKLRPTLSASSAPFTGDAIGAFSSDGSGSSDGSDDPLAFYGVPSYRSYWDANTRYGRDPWRDLERDVERDPWHTPWRGSRSTRWREPSFPPALPPLALPSQYDQPWQPPDTPVRRSNI